jgi:hypothetical protein
MSYGISVYCCDLARFAEKLSIERIAETDVWLRQQKMRDDDCAHILAFVRGRPIAPSHATHHAFERMIERLGRPLPNAFVSPIAHATFAKVDACLANAKLPIALTTLCFGGSPAGLSITGDNDPGVGVWSAERVSTAQRYFEEQGFPETADPEVEEVLTDISEWLEIASLRREGIVGYYY